MNKSEDQKKSDSGVCGIRESALKWWLSINFDDKFFATIEWSRKNGVITTDKRLQKLTDEEITEIYIIRHSL